MLDDRISGDEMRAFIVCADNEPEWLLYDGQGWCRDQRGELSKLIRLSRLLLMDFLCYQNTQDVRIKIGRY